MFSAPGCRHYWLPAGPGCNPRPVNMSPFSFSFLAWHGVGADSPMRPSRGFPALHHLLSGLSFFQLRLFGPEFGDAIRVYCVQYIENCSVLSHIRIPHRATGHTNVFSTQFPADHSSEDACNGGKCKFPRWSTNPIPVWGRRQSAFPSPCWSLRLSGAVKSKLVDPVDTLEL